MKKSSSVVMAVIVVIFVAAGAYMVFHRSSKPNSSNAKTSSSQKTAPAINNAVVVTKTDSKLGQYLADPSSKPLYTYNGDSSGVSNCTGSCLANWPAYTATGSTSSLPSGIDTIKRSDNSQTQYTYNGMPLYYFTSDSAGHPTGDGVENFKIAKPAASQSDSAPSDSAPSSTDDNSPNPYNY